MDVPPIDSSFMPIILEESDPLEEMACSNIRKISQSSEELFSQPSYYQPNIRSSFPKYENIPNFDHDKALQYLRSLHDYLKELGGAHIYAILKEKTPEEREEIIKKLDILLLPINKNLDTAKILPGGNFHSISLESFFSRLETAIEAIIILNDPKAMAIKILTFFLNLGCNDKIVEEFQ